MRACARACKCKITLKAYASHRRPPDLCFKPQTPRRFIKVLENDGECPNSTLRTTTVSNATCRATPSFLPRMRIYHAPTPCNEGRSTSCTLMCSTTSPPDFEDNVCATLQCFFQTAGSYISLYSTFCHLRRPLGAYSC